MIYRPSSLIPVSSSSFAGNERIYLLDCLSHNWITQGRYVRLFEEKFAEWSGRKHAIACSSGTAALHLALRTTGVASVIVPAMTYIATANAAKYCNMEVEFFDVDRDSWCLQTRMDTNLVTFHPCLVLGVDLYDSLFVGSTSYLYAVDASESGQSCHGALFSTVSFYGSKLITTGEGGMVLADDADLAQQSLNRNEVIKAHFTTSFSISHT